MATLTETAYKVRQGIKFGGVGFVAITVLWFLGNAAIAYYKALNPAPPPPPTVDFGALPPVVFPKETGRPNVELELPTGAIPAFPDRMMVYFAPTKRSGFLDSQKAVDTGSVMGFIFKPEQPSETRYVWHKQDDLNSSLDMDIVSGYFKLSRAWQNNPALLDSSNFISDKQVVLDVANYLNRIGLMPEDVNGNEKVTYLKSSGSKLVPALSLSDAEFIQVDLFRNDVDILDEKSEKKTVIGHYSFYRPDANRGLIRTVVSGAADTDSKIVSMDHNYTRVEYDTKGTYPIKSGDVAWKELKAGQGYVTDGSPKTGTTKIRRVLLGYYDTDQVHKYMMPIYIFLGDQNFVAYVSAITDNYLQK